MVAAEAEAGTVAAVVAAVAAEAAVAAAGTQPPYDHSNLSRLSNTDTFGFFVRWIWG